MNTNNEKGACGAVAVARDTSEIQSAIYAIEEKAYHLNSMLENLKDRLTPVLSGELPSDCCTEESCKDPYVNSPIRCQLLNINNSLVNVEDKINDIVFRLEV